MTNIKSIPYFQKIVEECKESAYSRVFDYIHNLSEYEIIIEYKKRLNSTYNSKEIREGDRDLSLPSNNFIEKTIYKYEKAKSFVEGLFKEADCLTYDISETISMNHDVFHKQIELEKENKYLVSKKAVFAHEDENYLIFFSDGTLLKDPKFIKDEAVSHFKEIIIKEGYEVKKEIEIDHYLSIKINAYARRKYIDEIITKELPDMKTFVNDLFKNGNICITATKGVRLEPNSRKGFAYFSNGRMIRAKECHYLQDKSLHKNRRSFHHENKNFIFLEPEAVPLEYIEAIYKKASDFDWYVSEEENSKKEPFLKKENKSFDDVASEKRGTNKCLSITNFDSVIKNDKDNFLLFEDGTLLVNEKSHYNAPYSPIETVVAKKFPNMKLVKKPVSKQELHEAYERALRAQKTCREIFSEMLKKKAKKLGKMENIAHHEALEVVAKRNNFNNWKEVCELDEDFARACIDREKEAKFYLDTFFKEPKELVEKNNISIEKARDISAQKHGFKNWEDILIGSYFEIMELFKSR